MQGPDPLKNVQYYYQNVLPWVEEVFLPSAFANQYRPIYKIQYSRIPYNNQVDFSLR